MMKPLTAGMHLSPMLAARDAVAALAARREGRTAPLRYDVPGQAYEYERPAGQRDPDEHRGPGVHRVSEVEIDDDEVRIGEAENLVILKKAECKVRVEAIPSGQLSKV
jgi:hypothetical protein